MNATVSISECAVAIHLRLLPLSFVYMPLSPLILADALKFPFLKLSGVYGSISVHSSPIVSMSLVLVPESLILREHAILIPIPTEHVQPIAVTNELPIISLPRLRDKARLLIEVGHLAIVKRSIVGESVTFEFS